MRLPGELLRPEGDGHEEVRRLWNGMSDRKPALIEVWNKGNLQGMGCTMGA
jgi:hypothetical protein